MTIGNTGSLSVDVLASEYTAGKSAYRIAKDNGCSIWSVITRLRRAGVEIRPDGVPKKLSMTAEQKDQFSSLNVGLLLGDGSVNGNATTRREKCFLRMEQSNRRRGWLDWLVERYSGMGVHVNVIPVKPKTHKAVLENGRLIRTGPSSLFYTGVSDEFRTLREEWYPGDGTKMVPTSLRLDPLSVAMWFCGDGSTGGKEAGTLGFYTNGFSRKEVEFLSSSLRSSIGVETKLKKHSRPGEWTLWTVNKNESVKLRDTMVPFIPECCMYKFSHIRPGEVK